MEVFITKSIITFWSLQQMKNSNEHLYRLRLSQLSQLPISMFIY